MDPELAKLLTTLGVAAVGVGGTALGAWLNQRGAQRVAQRAFQGQSEIELVKDRRALRDKKRERLQAPFEHMLRAARTLRDVIQARRFTWGDETPEERDTKLNNALRTVLQDIEGAQIHLRLEPGTAALADKFDETFNAFMNVGLLQRLRQGDSTEAISLEQIQEAENKVRAGVRELEDTMRTTLAELDQPIAQ